MARFKVGDKVTIVKIKKSKNDPIPKKEAMLGKDFTINFLDDDDWPYKMRAKDMFWFAEDEVELAEIANSPLYKALS